MSFLSRLCIKLASIGVAAGVLTLSFPAQATDIWEPDNSPASASTYLVAGHPPQVRDLQSTGGVADTDWIRFWIRSYRSYEARITNSSNYATPVSFRRWNSSGSSLLQSGDGHQSETIFGVGGTGFYMRWQTGDLALGNRVEQLQIIGEASSTAANSIYTLQFRESTLFCPRFNNAVTQVSVLLVQAAGDGLSSCDFSAHFFRESDGAYLATQTGALNFVGYNGPHAAIRVHALPGVPGLAGEKGAVQIAHTCGYGNLKAKVVALEPATGFSFDTPCTVREQ